MRIGIIALLHESNTFVRDSTCIERFHQDMYLVGSPIRRELQESHHEVGGFFAGLNSAGASVEAVPLVAFRATPSGVITDATFESLSQTMFEQLHAVHTLDGILVAFHGAAVSQSYPDADGELLSRIRHAVGREVPVVGTLDAHANLSPLMVDSCDALVAYRTNPHLDQRERGREAARLIIATVREEIQPTMAAAFPPMAINIERQCTDEPHLSHLYDRADLQLRDPDVLSNSILLGFPYADVAEFGAAAIAVTNGSAAKAQANADELGRAMWSSREAMRGQLVSIDQAIEQCFEASDARVCLLDMGDNVGGGSAGDGTALAEALVLRKLDDCFACLYDPQAVQRCDAVGVGSRLRISVGGKTDDQHGPPLTLDVEVLAIRDGRFTEDQPRHGGIAEFNQGRTAIVRAIGSKLTLMLTSLRVPPFSLRQLTSFGLDPKQFRVLVAKGVNAPIAAYRDVCDRFIRVNTIGSTCADLKTLSFQQRRKPMFPFEADARWKKGR